ncbi:hypothetical protein WJX84_005578 [Apatococcus fuscideae]|uniref:Uncharacterized protein n=1 Tax=Apatococcus fuscideae TaxID=2026836 RepID=A0AAW1T193_9CHLO
MHAGCPRPRDWSGCGPTKHRIYSFHSGGGLCFALNPCKRQAWKARPDSHHRFRERIRVSLCAVAIWRDNHKSRPNLGLGSICRLPCLLLQESFGHKGKRI